MQTQHISWITGWGVPKDWWRPAAEKLLPARHHEFMNPSLEDVDRAGKSDVVIAWSLGASLVLKAMASAVPWSAKTILLAPFLAFCAEDKCGGRCSRIQLKWLRRWVERDPANALRDFYERAGIHDVDLSQAPSQEALLWGLDTLGKPPGTDLLCWAKAGVRDNMNALIGAHDGLLDPAVVASTLPGCAIVDAAGHSALDLMWHIPRLLHAI